MSRRPLVLPLLALLSLGQAAPPASYQGPAPFAVSDLPAAEKKPLWTLSVDKAEYGEQTVAVAGGRVFVKVGGAVQARDLASGKVMWQAANAGRLWAASAAGVLTETDGTLVSRRPSDGRVLWRKAVSAVRDVQVRGETLYVTTAQGALALNAATGKTRWNSADSQLTGFGTAASGVVFWRASKGEPHFPAVVALNGVTGKRLYEFGSEVGPLAIKDGQALLKDFGAMGPDDRAAWQWVDLYTGKTRRVGNLQADFRCPGTGMVQHTGTDGFYADGFYYLNDRCGTRLTQFADTGRAAPTPLTPTRTFAAPDDGRYRLGPVGEYLMFESRSGEVRLIPTAGRSPVNLNGVDMPTGTGFALPGVGQVSRLDVHDGVLYVGRVGGEFLAYDVTKKRALYTVRLPWQGFGPTLRSGGYAVLTTGGAAAAVRE
ncbi:PQQ-binding-like beta-propeller repeat protein [Deinococcus sp. VB343]|uniref:outer membrane protein assembly factor BamB family protein n=1 Tax=Deinococcus sp. VB343 TaxID=3385567 RepID=UPI0039C97CBE